MTASLPIKRVAIEADDHELAAALKCHSARLAQICNGISLPEADDLMVALETVRRLQELLALAEKLRE